ncbi:MAG: TolC family protein [Deltaproteobacteria bacterium]|nr:TolC family protein [Deltaproteobacteria bacterium]MBW2362054.1 TolC family protein [Deltaproteobacteria bacterium]
MIVESFGDARTIGAAWILLSAMLLAPGTTDAQEGGDAAHRLTLVEAQALGRTISPELAAAREAVVAARGQERQAGAFLNPSVVYVHEETSQSGETNREDIALFQQPLEVAGQRGLRKEAARLRREAAEAQLSAVELDVDFEVARAYATAAAADLKAARSTEAADAFARARETSARRRKRGDVSGYEDRRTALEAARYAALRADAERELRTARAHMRSLIFASPEATSALQGPLDDTLDEGALGPDLDQLRRVALDQHPAIRAAELAHRSDEAGARLSRREVVPDPTLGLGYKREKMADVSGSWDGFTAQVTVPVPLWDRRGGTVEAAEAEARRSAAELRRERRRVALEVEQSFYELQATSEQLEVIRPQLGAEAKRALQAARTAYEEGEIALVEWLDAVRAYYEAESSYADLLADHLIRRAALERAVGGSLQ